MPAERISQRISTCNMVGGLSGSRARKGRFHASAVLMRGTIEEGGKFYQAFLGAGHPEKAAAIADRLVAFSKSGETYATLASRAALAGNKALAQDHLERATKALPEDEVRMVKLAMADPEKFTIDDALFNEERAQSSQGEAVGEE